jgi:hypothetical protein
MTNDLVMTPHQYEILLMVAKTVSVRLSEITQKTRTSLISKGWLSIKETNDGMRVQLTYDGYRRLMSYMVAKYPAEAIEIFRDGIEAGH